MSVHRIRLVGPWDFVWLESTGTVEPVVKTGTVKMPNTWQGIFGSADGRVIFSRKFHCPTNLEPDERVRITIDHPCGTGLVALNDQILGKFDSADEVNFDVTNRLLPFNVLTVTLHHTPSLSVAGEIREVFTSVALDIGH